LWLEAQVLSSWPTSVTTSSRRLVCSHTYDSMCVCVGGGGLEEHRARG
jgi:hypothetical protein